MFELIKRKNKHIKWWKQFKTSKTSCKQHGLMKNWKKHLSLEEPKI